MTHEERVGEMLRQMAGSVVPVDDPDRLSQRRERIVERMRSLHQAAMETKRREVSRRRIMAWAAAAAIPAFVAGASWYAWGHRQPSSEAVAHMEACVPGVELVHGVTTAAASGSTSVQLGDEVRTGADANASVKLPSGVTLMLAPSTRLAFDNMSIPGDVVHEQISLRGGRVDVVVPALGSQGSFVVATPDARVVVHGTRFSVIVRESGEPKTGVDVTEGHVAVMHGDEQYELGPGASWPPAAASVTTAPPADPAPAADASAVPSGDLPAPPASAHSHDTPRTDTTGRTSSSTLAKENELFAGAVRARQAGDDARAIKLLDQLLALYPRSPLAAAAKRERARASQHMQAGSK